MIVFFIVINPPSAYRVSNEWRMFRLYEMAAFGIIGSVLLGVSIYVYRRDQSMVVKCMAVLSMLINVCFIANSAWSLYVHT